MQIYKYQAISKGGEKVSGVIDGFNEFDAVERIKKTCDVILTISQVKEDAPGLLNMEIGGNKLNTKAFTVMCSQFAIILRSGIPIARTIHLIADKTTDKKINHILKQVGEDVEAGHSVYASFKERGEKLFPQIFLETIRAGEESGSLDKAFETMYLHYDKQVKLKNKVKGALAYPAFVLFVAIVVVIVLMVAVVPTFTAIFESYGAQLPLITQALIAISNFFRDYWLVLAIIAIALVIVYKFVSANEDGRLWLAKTSLKLPVFGNINILTAASEFANSMTTMLGAGLPITRSLSISAKVISNYYINNYATTYTVDNVIPGTYTDGCEEKCLVEAGDIAWCQAMSQDTNGDGLDEAHIWYYGGDDDSMDKNADWYVNAPAEKFPGYNESVCSIAWWTPDTFETPEDDYTDEALNVGLHYSWDGFGVREDAEVFASLIEDPYYSFYAAGAGGAHIYRADEEVPYFPSFLDLYDTWYIQYAWNDDGITYMGAGLSASELEILSNGLLYAGYSNENDPRGAYLFTEMRMVSDAKADGTDADDWVVVYESDDGLWQMQLRPDPENQMLYVTWYEWTEADHSDEPTGMNLVYSRIAG